MKSMWSRVLVVVLLLWVATAQEVKAAEATPNAVVLEKSADSVIRQLVERLQSHSDRFHRIALLAKGTSPVDAWFEERLAPRLLDAGWEVWTLQAGQSPVEGALLLEYSVEAAQVQYLGETRGFLGLGTPKVRRQTDLRVESRLVDPGTGRLFWREIFDSSRRDGFASTAVSVVEADQPGWLDKPKLDESDGGRAGFLEKVLIAGLVGGVIALYVAGAQ